MYFERKAYLKELISAEGNGMIKIITGIRRCGKSFLLFNIFRKHLLERGVAEDHIIQVNLEDRRNKKLRDPDALLEHIDALMKDKDRYYILLDEVQMVKEFEEGCAQLLSPCGKCRSVCYWFQCPILIEGCDN